MTNHPLLPYLWWNQKRLPYVWCSDSVLSSPELPKLLQGRQRRHEGLSPPIDDLKRALSDGGYQVTEQDHLLQIMAGTQEDFGPYISIQTGNCALKDIDRNELCDQLIKQDMYRKTSKSHKNGKVFMTGAPSSQSQNGELRIETDATGRHVTKPTSKRSPVYNQSNRRCYNCHEIGHISKDCPNPKKDRSTNKAASSDEESANKSKHKKQRRKANTSKRNEQRRKQRQ